MALPKYSEVIDVEPDRLPQSRHRSVGWGMQHTGTLAVAVLVASAVALVLSIASFAKVNDDSTQSSVTSLRAIPLRLLPGSDVVSSLMQIVNARGLKSAWVSTAVGSLTQYNIRFANMPDGSIGQGHFEIVSLVGTMTSLNITNLTFTTPRPIAGAWHLHISVGDGNGTTISGHLLTDSIIYTTLEATLISDCSKVFYRSDDGTTGWDELQIRDERWC